MWQRARETGAASSRPALPTLPANADGVPPDDPRWATALVVHFAETYDWAVKGAVPYTFTPSARGEQAPSPIASAQSPVAAAPSPIAPLVPPPASPLSPPPAPTSPSTAQTLATAPISPAVPTTMPGAFEADKAASEITRILEAVPTWLRPEPQAIDTVIAAMRERGGGAFADVAALGAWQGVCAAFTRLGQAVPAHAATATALHAALAGAPFMVEPRVGDTSASAPIALEPRDALGDAPIGTIIAIDAPAIRLPGPNGGDPAVVLPARVAVVSKRVSQARADLERFVALGEAIDLAMPHVPAAQRAFVARLGEAIDLRGDGDPLSTAGRALLPQLIDALARLRYAIAVPEFGPILAGLDDGVTELARLFTLANPGARAWPIGAPAQIIDALDTAPAGSLIHIPDTAPAGTVLRVRTVGLNNADGSVISQARVVVSSGPTPVSLARAFSSIARVMRMRIADFAAGTFNAAIDRVDDLLAQHTDATEADDGDKRALALRYLLNHVDETALALGDQLRHGNRPSSDRALTAAGDALVLELEALDLRPIRISVGGRYDASYPPSKVDVKRAAGSGAGVDVILAIQRRGLVDKDGLVVQKAIVVVSA